MSRADDDMDDEGLEGLGSFRAMFREMPDEEPPQRGLAELMAAARVKAEEMATPSLWERFLQTMRRPQVMALATIMILIGGAVFISQRKSEMDASPTASQSYQAEPVGEAIATGASAGSGMAAAEAEKKEESAGVVAADQGAAADSKTDDKRDRAETDLAKGARGDADGKANEKSTRSIAPSEPVGRIETRAPSKVSKSKAPSKPTASSGKMRSEDLFEGGLDDEATRRPGTGASGGGAGTTSGPKAGGAAPVQAPEAEPATTTSTDKQPALTVQQMHTNARKLATAGECAQVRTVAKQIAAKDAKYYRNNIATDSLLATCLK